MTKDVFEKLPEAVYAQLESIRKDYKNRALNREETRARLAGYVQGLRDAGLISERERQILFAYGTV